MNSRDIRLQNILNVVALTSLIFIVAACDIDKCSPFKGTFELKNEPYKGKQGVVVPHADDPAKITPGPADCDIYTKHCGYFPLVRIGIHNPTDKIVVAHVSCSFFVGDWNAGKNERSGVRVNPYSTKYVELQFNISVEGDRRAHFATSCITSFK